MSKTSVESQRQADQDHQYRQLIIDFLHLDMSTCKRHIATEDALDGALAALAPAFHVLRIVPNVNRVIIDTREQAEQYRLMSSPTIRVDGVDVCPELKETHCGDCSDLSGGPTNCRVFVYQGQDYEQPTAGMITDGILRILYGQQTVKEPASYVMPDNLVDYFNRRPSHA